MINRSISNPGIFKILDTNSNEVYFGGSQEWYGKEWQRVSGCGPTAASNIIFYLNRIHNVFKLGKNLNIKENWLAFMEEIWNYVTPSKNGIPSVEMFCDKMLVYAGLQKITLQYYCCNLPEDKNMRPKMFEVLTFIEKGLAKDVPVAFLNLCNGGEKNLEKWHWVTVISLDYTEDKKSIFLYILDGGIVKKIDLVLWYATTTQGGGFVYFV